VKVLELIDSPRGFKICPVHYSHDPDKTVEWVTKEQQKYVKEFGDWEGEWQREMEVDFTSVAGVRAYASFSDVNLKRKLAYNRSLPLCIDCDFNVEPMIWEICQRVGDRLIYFDEIKLSPAEIRDMVNEFRNRYPDHPAEIWVYGDATGNKRTAQTASSDYDLMRLYFRGYPSPRIFKVTTFNPPVKDRVNAVNLKLRGAEGQPGILIDPEKCPELVKDLKEVTMKDGKIVKSNKKDDPYYYRTHASDGVGYHVYREWPVVTEVHRHSRKKRGPLKYKSLRGMAGL